MFRAEPVRQDLGRVTRFRAIYTKRPLARHAQQLAVNRDAGPRVDFIERNRVVIVSYRKGVSAKVKLQIGPAIGMRHIGECTDLERSRCHYTRPCQ